jgi:hypothetical protein
MRNADFGLRIEESSEAFLFSLRIPHSEIHNRLAAARVA